MPKYLYDYNPARFLTINTIGEPGQRTFLLQAGVSGFELFTLICEKEQARALAEGILALLDEIAERDPEAMEEDADLLFDLREPIIPVGRVGNMGIGYDEDSRSLVVLVQLLTPEEDEEGQVARVVAPLNFARPFALHTLQVVAAGRPICPFCGEPIDKDGHVCGGSNGHQKHYVQ